VETGFVVGTALKAGNCSRRKTSTPPQPDTASGTQLKCSRRSARVVMSQRPAGESGTLSGTPSCAYVFACVCVCVFVCVPTFFSNAMDRKTVPSSSTSNATSC
jgi:hypothetical protein